MSEKVKCSKCGKEFPESEMKKTGKGTYLCQNCRKKSKVIVWVVLLLIIAAAIFALLKFRGQKLQGNNEEINVEEVVVDVADIPQFNISLTTAIRQLSVADPIDNLTMFQRATENSTMVAKENNSETIEIPDIFVLFDFNKAELHQNPQDLLNEFAKVYCQTNKQANICIEGFGCNIGSQKANEIVSKKRSETVAELLVAAGVPNENIEILWFGKNRNNEFNYKTIEEYRRVIIRIK